MLACASHAAHAHRLRLAEVNLVVVGDRQMARLHRDYMGIGGTTDVLTFNLSDSNSARVDGDIYICLDQARRQARDYHVSLRQEMARLAVHGILHLAGFDDSTEQQRRHMRSLEDRTLNAVRDKL